MKIKNDLIGKWWLKILLKYLPIFPTIINSESIVFLFGKLIFLMLVALNSAINTCENIHRQHTQFRIPTKCFKLICKLNIKIEAKVNLHITSKYWAVYKLCVPYNIMIEIFIGICWYSHSYIYIHIHYIGMKAFWFWLLSKSRKLIIRNAFYDVIYINI